MATKPGFPAEGGCTCRSVRYRIATEPLFVHCCHCRWCQRETGAAFAINALIESSRVEVLSGQPEPVVTSSKQPWVILPPDVPAADEYYDRNAHWPPQSLERRRVLLAALAASQNEAPAR